MSYKQLGILLLLQIFLFIQCTTAETANNEKKAKNNKSKHSFIDTNTNKNSAVNANNISANNKNAAINKSGQTIKAGGFKQVKFGFNIGYLSGLQNKNLYIKALTQIKKDGITNLRVYEPFNKNISRNPEMIATVLKSVTNAGFNILLCFSNYPFDSSSANKQLAVNEHAEELKFTNRYAPSDLNKYGAVLTRILNKIKDEGVMQNLSFEIGNEPTAKKYFWGDGVSFGRIARLTQSILAKYNQPVYCCGFNTQFAVNDQAFDKSYMNLLNDQSFFNNVNLSFHFYPNQKFQFSDINLPHVNNAIISEFNIFSYQKQGTENKIQYSNSSAFGKWMSELLEYAYDNNIQAVYLFNLIDDPKKAGALGFFNADGNPKQSYNYFVQLYNVIKDGYKVEKNNNTVKIIGQKQTIVYLKNNTNTVSKGRASRNQNEDGNDWKIINN